MILAICHEMASATGGQDEENDDERRGNVSTPPSSEPKFKLPVCFSFTAETRRCPNRSAFRK